jgi:uncharacterized protein YbjT (DUF2867 family)
MIVIIGATGKVGSKTAEILLAKGQKVRLIARHADKLNAFKAKGAEIAVGDSNDEEFLTKAFKGADVVMTMLPADFQSDDVGTSQDEMGEAQAYAIKKSGIKYVVNLSSLGGHTEVNTGIVAGLARQEVRLNKIEDVNILHLRPTYFFENLLNNIPMIKSQGINGTALAPDVKLPMITTQDIAKVAAEKLMSKDFKGKSVLSLLGPKEYTMNEVTQAIGKAIGKPDLKYVQLSYDEAKNGLMQFGVAESPAEAFVGLMKGINLGVFEGEKRTPASTTMTTVDEFAKSFAQFYGMN